MGGIDTNIAAAALAISLVAFITALGQFFQQYLATADGYRRCQRSVMGDWAQKTRLRWRWREFRFETLYTTPEIIMGYENSSSRFDFSRITGSEGSRVSTLVSRNSSEVLNDSHEMACWVELLLGIHTCIASYGSEKETVNNGRVPGLFFQERSWDFQLPDVVRPLAKTSVEAIAVIARRMGMRWKDFRPVDGVMRAEGNQQIITATLVRSIGAVLQYSKTSRLLATPEYPEIYIPTKGSDALGFAIIIPDYYINFGGDPLSVGTRQQLLTALRILEPSGHCATKLQILYNTDPDYNFRMGDLIAILMPMQRFRNSRFTQIPAPSENMLGFTQSAEGRHAFRQCLEAYCGDHEVGDQAKLVLQTCQTLSEGHRGWDEELKEPDHTDWIRATKFQFTPESMDSFDSEHKKALQLARSHCYYFSGLPKRVLSAHIRFGIFREGSETTISASQSPDYESEVKGYFAEWPKMLEYLLSRHHDFPPGALRALGLQTPQAVEKFYFDAWVTMLFRACCWGACHDFVPGERVPSEWWGSHLPIYIG
jgi:hypothetical protein